MDVAQNFGGTPRGRAQRQRLALAGIGVLVLLVGGITWGIVASGPGHPAWQPASINNLVLEEGPEPITTGTDYHPIAIRAEDPVPLTTAELAKVLPPSQGGGPMQVSTDCVGAVTGQPVIRALTAAGCSQVLRMVVTASGTTPAVGQVDIFNLAGGPSLIWVARAFGQEPPSGGPNPSRPSPPTPRRAASSCPGRGPPPPALPVLPATPRTLMRLGTSSL